MRKFDAVLVLVPVLPALAGPREPPSGEVSLVPSIPWPFPAPSGENRDGDCTCVDTPSSFSRRYALNAVPARLMRESLNAVGFDYRARVIRANAVLSTARGEVAAIGGGKVLGEQFGVVTAFRRSNLDNHVSLASRQAFASISPQPVQ